MLKVRSNWAYFSPLKSDLVVNHQQQKEGQNHHRQPKAHVPLTITQAKEYFSILDNSSEKKTGQEFCHGNQTRHSEILNTVSTVHLFWKFKFLAKAKSSLILALAVQLKLLVAFFSWRPDPCELCNVCEFDLLGTQYMAWCVRWKLWNFS